MFPAIRNGASLAPVAAGPINRLDTLFDQVFGEDGRRLGRAWPAAPVAMWEDEDRIHIEAELPGVRDEDLDVTVHKDTLTIRGERKPEEGRRYLYNGRSYGRFEHVIALPEAVQVDDVQAALVGGVLRLDLPKSPEARPRKITLRTS